MQVDGRVGERSPAAAARRAIPQIQKTFCLMHF